MEAPEKVKKFTKSELDSLVEKINTQGIVGDWEEPLISHHMDVKVWCFECTEYIANLAKLKLRLTDNAAELELRLTDNTAGTDRILYNPEKYTREQAVEYGDSNE